MFVIRVNVPGFVPCFLRALRLLRDCGEQSRPRSHFGRTLKPTIIQDLHTQVEPISGWMRSGVEEGHRDESVVRADGLAGANSARMLSYWKGG